MDEKVQKRSDKTDFLKSEELILCLDLSLAIMSNLKEADFKKELPKSLVSGLFIVQKTHIFR